MHQGTLRKGSISQTPKQRENTCQSTKLCTQDQIKEPLEKGGCLKCPKIGIKQLQNRSKPQHITMMKMAQGCHGISQSRFDRNQNDRKAPIMATPMQANNLQQEIREKKDHIVHSIMTSFTRMNNIPKFLHHIVPQHQLTNKTTIEEKNSLTMTLKDTHELVGDP